MRTIVVCLMMLAMCFIAGAEDVLNVPKWAEEFKELAEKGSPDKVDWTEAAKLGSKGNVRIFFDKKGNPEVYVIGRASLSAILDAVDAEDDADEAAEFNAKAAFAVWMKEHFRVKSVRDKKILLVTKGTQDSYGAVSKNKQAESVGIAKRQAEQTASAFWRGMRKYTAKRTNGEYIAVWRWSLTEQKFARLIEMLTRDGDQGQSGRKIETFDWTFR